MQKEETKKTKWVRRLPLLLPALCILGVMSIPLLTRKQHQCAEVYRADGKVSVGSAQIAIEVPRDAEEMVRGLGGRSCIGYGQGMLFRFRKPAKHGFWMKDMNFSIDIVWLDTDDRVVTVLESVYPSTYPKIFKPTADAVAVLELRSGRAKELGITIGSKLESTIFSQ